jgi:hypothetical protein
VNLAAFEKVETAEKPRIVGNFISLRAVAFIPDLESIKRNHTINIPPSLLKKQERLSQRVVRRGHFMRVLANLLAEKAMEIRKP